MQMAVPMVDVGIMGVSVDHRPMTVRMAVRLAWRDAGRMLMLMMSVMDVPMVMLEWFVRMLMAVRFGQMQPEPDRHQDPGDDERRGDRLAEHRDRQRCADERCRREIGT